MDVYDKVSHSPYAAKPPILGATMLFGAQMTRAPLCFTARLASLSLSCSRQTGRSGSASMQEGGAHAHSLLDACTSLWTRWSGTWRATGMCTELQLTSTVQHTP